jgi:hypothetical protein
MKRYLFGLIVLAGAAGCESRDSRCKGLDDQALYARADALGKRQFWSALADRMPPGGDTDSLRKVMRAEEAERRRAEWIARYRERGWDTTDVPAIYDPAADSTDPRTTPPLRPSDELWYAEHCHEGRAR